MRRLGGWRERGAAAWIVVALLAGVVAVGVHSPRDEALAREGHLGTAVPAPSSSTSTAPSTTAPATTTAPTTAPPPPPTEPPATTPPAPPPTEPPATEPPAPPQAALVQPGAALAPPEQWTYDPYTGLGTWIDVYDWSATYTNDNPQISLADIDRMAGLGVQTLYVQPVRWDVETGV